MNLFRRATDRVDAEGPLTGLAFFRIVVGFMLWRHTWGFVTDHLHDGFYADRFHVPYWDWLVMPSATSYAVLLSVMLVCGLLIIVGYHTRWALVLGFIATTIHLFLNQFWYRHNRYFLVLSLFLLCFSPAHRALALDSARVPPKKRGWGPIWVLTLICLQMSLIYLASGGSKLLDPDWSGGRVLLDRAMRGEYDEGFDTGAAPPGSFAFWRVVSLFAITTELFLAIALWFPRSRRLAIWIGLLFHGYIEVRYSVLTFSYLTVATYFLFLSPQRRNRRFEYDPEIPVHQFLASCVGALDWLDKIKLVPRPGTPLRTQDSNGKWYRGCMAVCIAGCALCLTFPLAYPSSLLRFLGIGRSRDENVPTPTVSSSSPLRQSLSFVVLGGVATGIIFWLTPYIDLTLYLWEPRFFWLPMILLTFAVGAAIQRRLVPEPRD